VVGPLGPAGPSRARVSGRATPGPGTGPSRRTAGQETGRYRLDGHGYDGEDPAVAGWGSQRTARPAPDSAADRAGAALCGTSPPVDLYRWLVLVHPGDSRDLSRSRAHGHGRAATVALLAQHPDRSGGQTLRASSRHRYGTPLGRWHARTRRDAQKALAGRRGDQYGIHRAPECDVPGTPRAAGAAVPGAGPPDPDTARGDVLGGYGL